LPSTSAATAGHRASHALARPAKPAKKRRADGERRTHSGNNLRKAPSSGSVVLESVATDFAVSCDPTRTNCGHLLGGVPSVARSLATHEPSGERAASCGSPLFKLLPGEFEIVLCVDNREHYGSVGVCWTVIAC